MRTYRWPLSLLLSVCLAIGPWAAVWKTASAAGSVIFVKGDATGANNGTSWADAYRSLHTAISAATAGSTIWVAKGTYKPTGFGGTSPLTVNFRLKNNVGIYGGFAGTEDPATFDLSTRDFASNETILSGDIDSTPGLSGEDAYHVVYLYSGLNPNNHRDASAVLDGFTITGGNANGSGDYAYGGGVFINGHTPTLRNLVIRGNRAKIHGGGLALLGGSDLQMKNVAFIDNASEISGAGMYVDSSNPELTNVSFQGNTASQNGGAIYSIGSDPKLTKVSVRGNQAANGYAGGIYNYSSNPVLTNVLISGNKSQFGGGMYSSQSSPVLNQVTVTGNSGFELYNSANGNPIVRNSIIYGNGSSSINNYNSNPQFYNSLVSGSGGSAGWKTSFGTNGGGNTDGDPGFADAKKAGDAPTAAGDYRLHPGSPAIDAGNDTLLPAGTTTDLGGGVRTIGAHIDMGAYEFQGIALQSIAPLDDLEVLTGSAPAAGDLHLPARIGITLAGGGVSTAGVSWGASMPDYDGNTPGTYTFAGTLTLPAGVTNPDGPGQPTVTLKVIVGDRNIVSVSPISDASVQTFTKPAASDLSLPSQAMVTLEGGMTRTVNVQWDNGTPAYNGNKPGAYTFAGTLTPGIGIHNPDGLKATVNVIVSTKVIYVKQGASGSNNGNSWKDAYTDFQSALNAASAPGDIVWVAKGTYKPAANGSGRAVHFLLKNGVTVFGGFAGDEDPATFDLGGRDFAANETIFSGDIDGTPGLSGGDAYHVLARYLNEPALNATAVLDGVTISGGYANGTGYDQYGGGIYLDGGSPTLRNVTIRGNKAFRGGGIANESAQPIFTNVTIRDNEAADSGGGLYNSASLPQLTDVTIEGNTAGNNGGGGIFNNGSHPKLTGVKVRGNRAGFGGGIANYKSNPTLVNVLIGGNASGYSLGGMYNNESSPVLVHVTIGGNVGSGMNNSGGSRPVIRNSIIAGNGSEIYNTGGSMPYISHSLVTGSGGSSGWKPAYGTDGGGNLDADPRFAGAHQAGEAPTVEGDYRLQSVSPAIDAGSDSDLPSGITADLSGASRLSGAHVDMGAFEFQRIALILKSIEALNDIEVLTGAAPAMGDLQLPAQVGITLVGGGTSTAAVGWDGSTPAYDGNTPGTYTFTGTVTLPSDVTNPNGPAQPEVTLKVRVSDRTVTAVSALSDIHVPTYAIPAAADLKLPPQVSVTLDGGLTRSVNVSWNGGTPAYNGNKAGTYLFAGTLAPGIGIRNPDGLKAAVRVVVRTKVIYVKEGATGAKDGSSWHDAFTDLQSALDAAPAQGNIIWVARGTYKPTANGTGRGVHYRMENGVAIYGGFAGNEDPDAFDLGQRDFAANETIFSGDIDGKPGLTDGDAYHVFYHAFQYRPYLDATAVMDGVTITGGNADGNGEDAYGGGIYNNKSSPTLRNVTIRGNRASSRGGGISNQAASPVMTNIAIVGNRANEGGGMYNLAGAPRLTEAIVEGNTADLNGGGIHNSQSSARFTAVRVRGNTAVNSGGGIYTYMGDPSIVGALVSGNSSGYLGSGVVSDGGSHTELVHVTISGNKTTGLYTGGSSVTVVRNSVIFGNGTNVYNYMSTPRFKNSLIGGSGGSAAWNPSLGTDEGGNADGDPRFAGAMPAVSAPTLAGDYRLRVGSPAIDRGSDAELPAGIETDLPGAPRIAGVHVDMGAYEFQGIRWQTVAACEDIHVTTGSAPGVGDLHLPAAAEVTLEDGSVWPAPVSWGESAPAYNGGSPGTYTFSGTLSLPSGVVNPDGSETPAATVRVVVGDREIVSVSALPDILVRTGSKPAASDLKLPATVEVKAEGITGTKAVNVRWDGGVPAYDGRKPGTYVFTGTLEPGSGLKNTGGFKATVNVVVSTKVIYVKQGATGANNGSSWQNAYANLQPALEAATGAGDAIWIAEGTYKPTGNGDGRNAHFRLKNGVAVYGGFAGNEDPDTFQLALRDFTAHETILSGDLDDTGGLSDGDAYHVFNHDFRYKPYLDGSAVLDGVTITGGNANGENDFERYGGGMYNYGSSPTLRNVVFRGNGAAGRGGAIANEEGSHPTLSNAVIRDNEAMSGGGMYNANGSPVLTDALIEGNRAGESGGGIFNNHGSPVFTNVKIRANIAGIDGSGMYSFSGSAVLKQVLITGNQSPGSAVSNEANSDALLIHVTISGNAGGGITNIGSDPVIRNSIVYGNGSSLRNLLSSVPQVSGSLVEGSGGSSGWKPEYGADVGGNVDGDPRFAAPVPAAAAPTADGDYRLKFGSFAVDAGDDGQVPDGVIADLNGNARKIGSHVDMGVYEFEGVDVQSIGSLSEKRVAAGTVGGIGGLHLPAEIPVTLQDGSPASFPVGWDDAAPDFDGNTPGQYVFTGTLILPSGVRNPGGLTVSLNVIVLSGNVQLSELIVEDGAGKKWPLEPEFAPDTEVYEAAVPYGVASITLKPTAGTAGAKIQINGTETASGQASGPIPLAEGENTITVAVTADDGKWSKTYRLTIVRAISPGEMKLVPALTKSDGSPYTAGEWSAESVKIKVDADAGASAIASLTYSFDGGQAMPYASGTDIEIGEEGMHTILFEATDTAGHSLSFPIAVNIDRTPPSFSFGKNGSESWQRSVSTGAIVSDSASGVAEGSLQYAWTQSAETPDTGWMALENGDPPELNGVDGDWYLHIQALDRAGNRSNAATERFRLDNTAPVIHLAMKTADGDYADDTWTNREITVEATVTDADNAVSLAYSLDGGSSWNPYAASLSIQNDGVYALTFKAVDSAGNAALAHRTVKISRSGVTLTPTLATFSGSSYRSGEWTNDSVILHVYAEAASGVAALTYSLNGGQAVPYENGTEIRFDQEGEHSVVFQVIDASGRSLSVPLSIRIDRTPPSVGFGTSGSESWRRSASTQVTVSDTGSGVNALALRYAWTQQSTAPATGWLTFSNGTMLSKSDADGEWYLHVEAFDQAGNRVQASSNRYLLDSSIPVLSGISVSSGKLSPSFKPGTTNYEAAVENGVTSITVTPQTADANASIRVNGSPVAGGAGSMPIALQVGVNPIAIEVTSRNGESQTYEVKVIRAAGPPGGGGPGGGGPGGSGSGGTPETRTPAHTVTISAAAGGTVSVDRVTVRIPAGALARDFQVTVETVKDTSALPVGEETLLVGEVFTIVKDVPGNYEKPVTIVLPFDVTKVDTAKYEVGVYWFNEETKVWVKLDHIKVDPAAGTVSGDVLHFTKFAVLAVPKSEPPKEGPQAGASLTDIEGHWAKDAIQKLAQLGAVSGYADGTFRPDRTVTRAEFTAMLVKAFGLQEQGNASFDDTADHWAHDAIAAAVAAGIVSGYDSRRFGPDDKITREQMAVMVMRAAKLKPAAADVSFTDGKRISTWAKEAIAAVQQAGIARGYPNGSFRPQGSATRAEAVAMIAKALQSGA
ncbi:hypothetical protein GE107_25405 [Cohnella sp. CFH 77786]|uniref:Ig-like domain-containing protein n=1 Tax=Cohnella sp. CFH 77786 TaxID=2662265 RepID=UPI001C60F4A2|nr:Ig-like domain-containing protein [Cohnella sp. CFH 77786]MBW5449368.1 hypothetical protein [Cohnella sp. CFH 77786]